MYGSIFRFQPLPGKEQDLTDLMRAEERQDAQRLKAAGWVSTYVFKLDQGGMMGVAIFESKEKYQANASDPRQDEWYRKFRALLASDPEWNDGEVIASA
jgi:hypothetical protein